MKNFITPIVIAIIFCILANTLGEVQLKNRSIITKQTQEIAVNNVIMENEE